MLDRRRLLQSAALGAGLYAVGGAVGGAAAAARPQDGDAAGGVDGAFKSFMDKTFEGTLDRAPEVVTMFGLDKGRARRRQVAADSPDPRRGRGPARLHSPAGRRLGPHRQARSVAPQSELLRQHQG